MGASFEPAQKWRLARAGEDADLIVAALGIGEGVDANGVVVLGEDDFVGLPVGTGIVG